MTQFNVIKAREIYNDLYFSQYGSDPCNDESKEAILFAKALYIQLNGEKIVFCADKEFFVSKTPTGYAVTGLYQRGDAEKTPFNITVCKIEGNWSLSEKYIAADTKSVSGSLLLWVLLMVGCSLFGLISYWILKASIGF